MPANHSASVSGFFVRMVVQDAGGNQGKNDGRLIHHVDVVEGADVGLSLERER